MKNGLVFLPLFAVDSRGPWTLPAMFPAPAAARLVFLGLRHGQWRVRTERPLDREADRRHPAKRNRPIASGRVGVPHAMALMVLLSGAGLAATWYVGQLLGIVGIIYLGINVAYSLGVKNLPLLDVFSVASGYVIRAVAGALAIDVEPSPWLSPPRRGALFIVLGRRYAEVRAWGDDAGQQRRP